MTVHLLEVGPEVKLEELAKSARRLGMTGGYELALAPDMTPEQRCQLRKAVNEALLTEPPKGLSSNPTGVLSRLAQILE